jgi:hypothetical protein
MKVKIGRGAMVQALNVFCGTWESHLIQTKLTSKTNLIYKQTYCFVLRKYFHPTPSSKPKKTHMSPISCSYFSKTKIPVSHSQKNKQFMLKTFPGHQKGFFTYLTLNVQ